MFVIRMMPGQKPYTKEELDRLYHLVGEAADEDPGEQDEADYVLPRNQEEK